MKKHSLWMGLTFLVATVVAVLWGILATQQPCSEATDNSIPRESVGNNNSDTFSQSALIDDEPSIDERYVSRRIVHLPPSDYYNGKIVRRRRGDNPFDPLPTVTNSGRMWDVTIELAHDEVLCYVPDYAAKDNDFLYLRNAVPELDAVDLTEATRITKHVFVHLADWPNLQYLEFRRWSANERRLNRDDLSAIGRLPRLTHLDLSGVGWVDGHVIFAIAEIATLEYLRVNVRGSYGCQPAMRRLTNLRALILGDLREPEAWLEAVSTLHNLEELYLGFNESPTDKSLDRLRNLTNLSYLGLTGIQNLTDSAMEPIGTLTQLKELTLWRTGPEFSGSGLHYLRDVPLRSVAFSFCKWLTDEVFEALGGCSSLDTLDLWECPNLTGAGLADLVVVSRLSKLTLRSCEGIRNANLRGLIDVIHSFTLTLDRCPQITQANIEELREANPRLAINFNR